MVKKVKKVAFDSKVFLATVNRGRPIVPVMTPRNSCRPAARFQLADM
jgi:hypothetical protein